MKAPIWILRPSNWPAVFLFLVALLCVLRWGHVFGAIEQAQKIGEIKGASESLAQFLSRLPASFEAQIFYAICLFGAAGMLTNYGVKWLKGEIGGSLIKYLFFNNIRGTLLSFFTTVGVGIGAITSGVFETAGGEFVGWFNVMWISLTNGFMWDATMNQGERPVWTQKQRDAAEVKP